MSVSELFAVKHHFPDCMSLFLRMNTVYLSIGSNIDPERNFVQCAADLDRLFQASNWSPVYQSKPVGMEGPDFLNAVVHILTELDLTTVARMLKDLERTQGRDVQDTAYSDRCLDVDLLLFNNVTIDSPTLVLPRPDLLTMAFVLVPMVDLAPTLEHPAVHKSMKVLLEELSASDPEQIKTLSKTELDL